MDDRYVPGDRATDAPRVWRRDGRALFAGVCAGLAEDLDLPLPIVRIVAVLFCVLPTGLAYLGLSLILRRRDAAVAGPGPGPGAGRTAGEWALLRHRFDTLEPRLGRIEAFVTAPEFELHRDFRRMGE